MNPITWTFRTALLRMLSIPLVAGVSMAAPALAQEKDAPSAEDILRSMSSYMGSTQALSANADIALEVVTKEGMKLQATSYGTLEMDRPSRFRIERKGMFSDAEFIYDGETLTILGNRADAYAQVEVPGTIDDALLAYEKETGIPAPAADLLFAKPYEVLSKGIEDSGYLGTTYVGGVKCHQIAFKENEVDWQLWVRADDKPLPMKYVITSKNQPQSPEYIIIFRDWDTDPEFDDQRFAFSPPEGARKVAITEVAEKVQEFAALEEKRQ